MDQRFVDTAIEAIEKGNAGEYDAMLLVWNGNTVSVGDVIENLHLDSFIEQDEETA